MSFENPYFSDDYLKHLENLPDGHPAKDKSRLTIIQSFAFPILMWFFDQARNRGQGRSHLMALVLIELAKRGEKVYVSDFSQWPTLGKTERVRNSMIDLIMHIIKKDFPNDIFEYRQSEQVLIYRGRKPK